jgi:hypothetical protein
MSRRATVGYIVVEARSVLTQSRDGVLWIPSGRYPRATVFGSRQAAQDAIDRTRQYALRHGYLWADSERRIVRLEEQR